MESMDVENCAVVRKETQSFHEARRRKMDRRWLLASIGIFLFGAIIYFSVERSNRAKAPNKSTAESEQHQGSAGMTLSTSSPGNGNGGATVAPAKGGEDSGDCQGVVYDCQTDRMGHDTPLYKGQALCNDVYRFGITPEGVFQWHNCTSGQVKIIQEDIPTVSYFSMASDATLRLFDASDQELWSKPSNVEIKFYAKCLPRPVLDCPYLHLHKGDAILNSIDSGVWNAQKIQKAYENLFD